MNVDNRYCRRWRFLQDAKIYESIAQSVAMRVAARVGAQLGGRANLCQPILDIDRTDSVARFEDGSGRIRFAEISVRASSTGRLFLGGVSSVEEFVLKRQASALRCGVFFYDKSRERAYFLSDKTILQRSRGFALRTVMPEEKHAADSFFEFASELLAGAETTNLPLQD